MQTTMMVYLHLRLVKLDYCDCDCVNDCDYFVLKKRNISKIGSVHIFGIPTYYTGNNPNCPPSNRNNSTNQKCKWTLLIESKRHLHVRAEPNHFRACSHGMSNVVWP